MRILDTADLHLNMSRYGVMDKNTPNLPFKSVDLMNAFEWVVDKAIDEIKPDLFVIPGDIFDNHKPGTVVQTFLNTQMARLNKANIPVVIVVGNHEVCRSHHPLQPLKALALPKCKVIEEPSIIKFKGANLCFFPYSLKVEQKIITIKEQFNQFKEEFKNKEDLADGPTFFFGHFGVNGACMSEYEVRDRKTAVRKGAHFINTNANDISVADIDSFGADYVFLGDYHRFQTLPTKNCYAMYSGSLEKTDFSESSQPKGFLVYDDENEEIDKLGKCRFIENKDCRPMLELKGNLVEIKEQFSKIDKKKYDNAVVKLSFEGSAIDATDFVANQDNLKLDISTSLGSIHIEDQKKIIESEEEKEKAVKMEEEILTKGDITQQDIVDCLYESIDEKEDDEEERRIIKEMADEYMKGAGSCKS